MSKLARLKTAPKLASATSTRQSRLQQNLIVSGAVVTYSSTRHAESEYMNI
jgi:hypothetical protein